MTVLGLTCDAVALLIVTLKLLLSITLFGLVGGETFRLIVTLKLLLNVFAIINQSSYRNVPLFTVNVILLETPS